MGWINVRNNVKWSWIAIVILFLCASLESQQRLFEISKLESEFSEQIEKEKELTSYLAKVTMETSLDVELLKYQINSVPDIFKVK